MGSRAKWVMHAMLVLRDFFRLVGLKDPHASFWPKHDLLGENRDGNILYLNADEDFAQ